MKLAQIATLLLATVLVLSAPVGADIPAGEKIYELWCSHCHNPDPMGHPGTMMLNLSRGEGYAVIMHNSRLTDEYIRLVVRRGLGMMPPFRETEISNSELSDLLAYIRSRHQEMSDE